MFPIIPLLIGAAIGAGTSYAATGDPKAAIVGGGAGMVTGGASSIAAAPAAAPAGQTAMLGTQTASQAAPITGYMANMPKVATIGSSNPAMMSIGGASYMPNIPRAAQGTSFLGGSGGIMKGMTSALGSSMPYIASMLSGEKEQHPYASSIVAGSKPIIGMRQGYQARPFRSMLGRRRA